MTTSLLTSTTTPDTDLDLDLDLDLNTATDTDDPRISAEVEQVIDRLEALASEQENLQAQLASCAMRETDSSCAAWPTE